jgi:hypothetical protein
MILAEWSVGVPGRSSRRHRRKLRRIDAGQTALLIVYIYVRSSADPVVSVRTTRG